MRKIKRNHAVAESLASQCACDVRSCKYRRNLCLCLNMRAKAPKTSATVNPKPSQESGLSHLADPQAGRQADRQLPSNNQQRGKTKASTLTQ